MEKYWLVERNLSDTTPEIPGGVEYGLVDDANPAPVEAVIFEGPNALQDVEQACEDINERQAAAAKKALEKLFGRPENEDMVTGIPPLDNQKEKSNNGGSKGKAQD